MIRSIRFENGYQVKLPGIGKKKLQFNDRLNLLSGPNGSGKSTILKALAESAGCGSGGWSAGDESQTGGQNRTMCGNSSYQVEWDGSPVFFQDCYSNSEKSFINPSFFDDFTHLRSTGEKRIGLINELINYIEERFLTWKMKKEERPTLLLDEIDNHIGFAGQALLWKEIFPRLIKKYQLVVSTHSIFPLLLKKENSLRQDNIISLYRGYEDICIGELARAVDFYNSSN
ncbi:MAG: AAA family ATPase [Spirochaetia bacterium]|jgi:predicted ATPase|nr:AAA family ATPase [Spirochaetia bacterium]